MVAPETPSPKTDLPPISADQASKYRLLVIEDEQPVRDSIVAYLEDCGFQVDVAENGQQGLERYRECEPDVVLCDLKMPTLDGMSVLRQLAASDQRTPVIVISGVGVMGDVVEALRLGATDYLTKPILDMEVLEHSIVRCLEYRKLRQENRAYRQRLEHANEELQQSLISLEQDHIAGRSVQAKIAPPSPKQFGDYCFTHTIIPSLYLSGDFIDYFTVGEQKVVFFIADVSGHGASSAFVTVLLKNLFARKRSDYTHRGDETVLSPVAMLERANRELLDTGIGKHATLCVGVIDLVEHRLSLSNASHLPQPVLHDGEEARYLSCEGMPVGLFADAQYSEIDLQLPDSFALSLFSDGILEVVPEEGVIAQERYLLERLQAKRVSVEVLKRAFELEQLDDAPDDIAMLLITRNID